MEKFGHGFKTFRTYLDKHGSDSITCTQRDDSIIVCLRRISSDLPNQSELLGYLKHIQDENSRWADQPAEQEPPVFERTDHADRVLDAYMRLEGQALPMRIAQFRRGTAGEDTPAQDLLDGVGSARITVILGEPGSGKTTALERLAWVNATRSLAQVPADGPDGDQDDASEALLVIPIPARLADYQGEDDLIPLLRRALNRRGLEFVSDLGVTATLKLREIQVVMLLDGLNEIERAYADKVLGAIRRHLADYPRHMLHLTCRTADFDQTRAAEMLPPETQLWNVQPLVDEVRYWGDAEGQSDVRVYLRCHLGDKSGERLYTRLRADDRLHSLARLPLFLHMFKEVAEGNEGELPADRGGLLERFVRSPRLWGRTAQDLRARAERSLEAVAWWMQANGVLEIDEDALYDELERVRGRRGYELDAMRRSLQVTGLLVSLGDERYRLLHQVVQEYCAAAHLVRQGDCAQQLPVLAREPWQREVCIMALWLQAELQTPDYLLGLMGDPAIDLWVRVAASEILAQVGDPRLQRNHYIGVAAIEPEMVVVPAGRAMLGGEDPEADDDELPQCEVAVDAFELAVYPVTNAEFGCFIEAGGYEDETLWTAGGRVWLRGEEALDAETEQMYRNFYHKLTDDVEGFIANLKQAQLLDDETADAYRNIAANWSEDDFVTVYAEQILGEQRREPAYWHDTRFNGPTQPVVGVNWYEAMAYVAWLERMTGRPYRLPSEAQWEWAARRSLRHYPWGDEWDAERCNWSGNHLNRPNPIGIYPHGATPDGLSELAGNVDEWTSTLYRPYPYHADDGREDSEEDGLRIVRGGSWYVGKARVRCTYRSGNDPRHGNNNFGMRLARRIPH